MLGSTGDLSQLPLSASEMPSPPAAVDTGLWEASSQGATLIWFEPQRLLKKLTCQRLKSGFSTKKRGLGLHEASGSSLVWPSLPLGALQPALCNETSHCHQKPELRNARGAPTGLSERKPAHSDEDPAQPKIKLKTIKIIF